VLKEATGSEKFSFDEKQLSCLFYPNSHVPEWQLSEFMRDNGTTKEGKQLSRDVAGVLQELSSKKGRKAFALVAPAFQGQFGSAVTPGMLRMAFRHLGFDGFVEVALFADVLTLKEALEFDRNIHTKNDYLLTSCCCPMWLAMIKKLYADLIPHVPPSVSPMIAAGRTVKKLHPDAITVFVGPCVAKKAEAKEKDIAGAVDYVLTFQETQDIFELLQVNLVEEYDEVREYSSEAGRVYARTGGVSEAVKATLARLNPNREIALEAQQADGVPNCKAMIDALVNGHTTANFFEGMGCLGGCSGGPKSILKKEIVCDNVNQYAKASRFKTPLDNPYVLELLYRLGFTTLGDLLTDKKFFSRQF
jgi:iron only hydrogenase large subunit-like protein